MKKLSLLLFSIFSLLGVFNAGADRYRGVFVLYNDGSRVLVELKPNMTASVSDDGTSLDFTYMNNYVPETVHSVTADKFDGFELTQQLGVDAVEAGFRLRATNDALYIYGVEADTPIAVYYVDGSLIVSRTISGDDVVNLAGREPGVYVIKLKGLTYKFMLK